MRHDHPTAGEVRGGPQATPALSSGSTARRSRAAPSSPSARSTTRTSPTGPDHLAVIPDRSLRLFLLRQRSRPVRNRGHRHLVGDVIGDGIPRVQFQIRRRTQWSSRSALARAETVAARPRPSRLTPPTAGPIPARGGGCDLYEPGGVAVIPTDLPSVDDSGCSSGTGTHCPITDVISGNVPATFTDDPEDPATSRSCKRAAGSSPTYRSPSPRRRSRSSARRPWPTAPPAIPLDSYELTPAQAAGILTYTWTDPEAQRANPTTTCAANCPARRPGEMRRGHADEQGQPAGRGGRWQVRER